MEPLLEAGQFCARDGEGRLLFERVGVRLDDARSTALSGPSGSGKSTLLRQLAGLDAGDSGATRRLAGTTYRGTALPAWRGQVTLMAQDAPMIPGTVGDNLELPFRLRGAGRAQPDRARARQLLEAVGLGSIAGSRDASTLSGGERHRLALVRGLLWDPPVLLADEPLAGLDDETAASCFGLLLEFAHRSGHTLLVVLHHGEFADRVDRTIRIAGAGLEEA